MATYGVVFQERGKVYYFNNDDENIENGSNVIVDTDNGEQLGIVEKKLVEDNNIENIKKIIRVATKKDYEQFKKNEQDATKALSEARAQAEKLHLKMRFIDAKYSFDRKQLLFNFLAEERIDFRELAKVLASIYKTRIELRQIGVRDKAKEIGGIGQCGRCLCCAGFLNNVGSISINMVKNQNIAINPAKINGQCGRLLCCLTYEDQEYKRCQKNMPSVGDSVQTEYGNGKVISVDILNRKYKVDIDGVRKEIVVSCEKCTK